MRGGFTYASHKSRLTPVYNRVFWALARRAARYHLSPDWTGNRHTFCEISAMLQPAHCPVDLSVRPPA